MCRKFKKCHIVRTAECLQKLHIFLSTPYDILDFQLFFNLMIACCSGRALARTGFTLVMTSTECTPRIAKKRWWIRIRRRIKSRYNHVITIIIIMLLIKKMMVIMVMNKLFFGASMWFGFWNNIDEWKGARWSSSVMKFSYVHSQASSWRASLVTVIARKGDSFQMVRLNVISYILC